MNALLSTTYFGPVQWYQKLYRSSQARIEACENFQKQTYRNRCIIATTQGTQALTVPTRSQDGRPQASLVSNILISDHGDWRRLHWNALCSAYGESPFFEYYEDDLRPFFAERRWTHLYDFNEQIRQTVCRLLDIAPNVSHTTTFAPPATAPAPAVAAPAQPHAGTALAVADYRYTIQPKHPAADPDFVPRPYYQVYAGRHGFQPNLSILDLLFNMGPEAIFFL